ncbi:hypothetical protein BRO54_0739 [Geobacillus proteiniphilus]|uniref:Mobile element protein n=1 Tax=Geobacillus proteiniphilus TaxID=860353 RepID=A0A1Q5T693_9BACL|nr:hypothetical protein BRO54_0739 [Geobacillus proteiniphilus]
MLIRKNPTGKYFVSVWVETDIQLLPTVDRRVGIDLNRMRRLTQWRQRTGKQKR